MINPEAKLNNKGFANIIAIIVAVVVLIGAGVGYLVVKKRTPITTPETPAVSTQETITDETTDWKIYRNEEYGFEFKYPPTWFIFESSNYVNLSDYDIYAPEYERGNRSGTKIQFVPTTSDQKEFPEVITKENLGGMQDKFRKVKEDEVSIIYKINEPNDGNCYYVLFHKKSDQRVCVFAWFQRENVDQIVLSTFKLTQ